MNTKKLFNAIILCIPITLLGFTVILFVKFPFTYAMGLWAFAIPISFGLTYLLLKKPEFAPDKRYFFVRPDTNKFVRDATPEEFIQFQKMDLEKNVEERNKLVSNLGGLLRAYSKTFLIIHFFVGSLLSTFIVLSK